jgi:hypothetical protein
LTAGRMTRFFAPTLALLVCLALGACSSFSGFVADSWPTWAGGMPKDVPPRPGAPGYEEFISHQQARDEAAAAAAATAAAGAPAGAQPGVAAAPVATPVAATAPPAAGNADRQPLPPAYRRTDDQGVVQGGLY